MTPTLTFDRGASELVIEAMGWEITSDGYLSSDDGAVTSFTGHIVHIDEFAGVVEYENGAVPLRDDFNELVEYIKHRRQQADG